MESNKYDDSAKGGYSYAEKLEAVAAGNMAPEEIGMASAEEAQLQIVPDAKRKPVFGTTMMFRAGVIPLELRAFWAEQEYKEQRKIISSETNFDKEAWMKANENEFPIQGDLICGQAAAKFGQKFKDPILGMCEMLRKAADMLEKKYTEAAEDTQPTDQQQNDTPLPDQQS
jgi:hypothetical protein